MATRLFLVIALLISLAQVTRGETNDARVLISDRVDGSSWVSTRGNTRSETRTASDLGRVPDALPLMHMQLLLKRPREREAALEQYMMQLHDRSSANFHQWLTAAQFGQRFGLSSVDLATIEGWLRSHGFTVNSVLPSTLAIDFSGTAEQVRSAFQAEIHYLQVGGSRHLANMSDPKIPAGFANAVEGIVSLHDFRPHTNFKRKPKFTFSVNGGTELAVAPADLATIYNLNPLFANGVSGQNQTIAVIENTNVSNSADWTSFRAAFGLSNFAGGSFTQVHPAPGSGVNNCANPGVLADNEMEAELDAEWASAAAPSAAIMLAACQDTSTTFGGLIAIQNLVNGSNPPAIISLSYGECEAQNGAAGNAAFNSIYQQAVAQGISVFVSTGDEGAASCDASQSSATHGIGVSGFASTAFNVAVGGTDFADTVARSNSTYWSATNSSSFSSALSYIPEIPWNDSCAGSLLTAFEGFVASAGSGGFCNSSLGSAFLTTASGSGGPSGCAFGAPAMPGVVSGTCKGYSKPSWQFVTGNPADGVRDLPDVSLFASNGVWGHLYIFCDSDTSDGGAACTGSPSSWSRGGGTSFASPILAGIQALVNQSTGARQGNPNVVYYALAASQFASTLGCNASSGNAVANGCVFYDVRQGDIDVNCQGALNCFDPSGANGVLSTSSNTLAPAYTAGVGWDFATGIGSINAFNLVNFWNSADVSLSGSGTITASGTAAISLTVADNGPQAASGVVVRTMVPAGATLIAGSSSACTQSAQSITCVVGALAKGGTATLAINIRPASVQTIDLHFSATSSIADLNQANGILRITLSPAIEAATDAPMPAWAYALLGLIFVGIVSRPANRNVVRAARQK